MPRSSKTKKSRPAAKTQTSKFVYGALLGVAIGTLAVLVAPSAAVNVLIGLLVVAAYIFFLTQQRRISGRWSPHVASSAPVLGALVVGVMSIAGVQYLGVSLAWHPEGKIKKFVQNVSAGGPSVDANSATSALQVKPGDILNYTVVVSNVAPYANNHENDMAYTVMTDTLPTGVQLVSDPNKRTISENIGTILPGKSVTKTYQIKVVSNISGSLIENKACFTANSVVKDNPQQGCDIAIIKNKIPPTPTPPTATPPTPPTPDSTPPPPTPTPPTPTPPTATPPSPTPPTPTPTPPTVTPPTPTPTPPNATPPPATTTPTSSELPNVGASGILVIVLFTVVTGYIISAVYGYMNSSKPIRFR